MGLFCHLQEISLLYLSYLLDKCRGLGLLKARMLVFYKTSQIPNQIKIYFFIFFLYKSSEKSWIRRSDEYWFMLDLVWPNLSQIRRKI